MRGNISQHPSDPEILQPLVPRAARFYPHLTEGEVS